MRTAPGAPVCDRLTTPDDRTRLLLSNRFAGMDAQSRLQAGAPNGGRFRGSGRMRPAESHPAKFPFIAGSRGV